MDKDQEAEIQKGKLRPETIILAGSSRLPEKIRGKNSYGYFAIYLEVDPVNSEIVDVSSTMVHSLGEKIIHEALLGSEIEEGIKEAIQQLERRFFGAKKRAIIAALEDAYKWYGKYLKENK